MKDNTAKKYLSTGLWYATVSFILSCIYIGTWPTDPEVREMTGHLEKGVIESVVYVSIYIFLLPAIFYLYRAAKEVKLFDLSKLSMPGKHNRPAQKILPEYKFITKIKHYLLQYFMMRAHSDDLSNKKTNSSIDA